MNQKIGFIGVGNMGSSLLQGILESENIDNSLFFINDHNMSNCLAVKAKFPDITIFESEKEVAREVDIIFLAVKPQSVSDVLAEIRKELKKTTVVVSLAAGMTLKQIKALIGYEQKIIRAMPNTPSLIHEGMCALTPNLEVSDEELSLVKSLFNCIGKTEVIQEDLMHAAIGLSGSAPAYVFMFIEALADGGVRAGMSRHKAYQFATQTVLGAAKLVQQTKMHPGDLKDRVCSPGGTTIAAVQKLEETGFRSAVLQAVEAAADRSRQLEKQGEIHS